MITLTFCSVIGFLAGLATAWFLDLLEVAALDSELAARERDLDDLRRKARDVRIALNGGFDDADADHAP